MAATSETKVTINRHVVKLTHLDKVFWPDEGYTKGDLIAYYRAIASIILPYLKDRPEALNRHPNGIKGSHFYQKNIEDAPKWVKTKTFHSETEDHDVNYLICQNEATLVYMINLGCIEINPWTARIQAPDKPDFCIIDLDPEKIAFQAVVQAAKTIHKILEAIGVNSYCKTSGATGLHICIPLGAKYSFEQSRQFAFLIATLANKELPKITSIVRSPKERQGKVYLDYLQNRHNQTIVAPYSVRPRPKAPVSTPLTWDEVDNHLNPQQFTIETIQKRIEKKGDLWKPVLGRGINLKKCISKLAYL